MFGGCKFPYGGGKAAIQLLETVDRLLQTRDILIDANGTQVFDCVLADIGFLAGFVGGRPQHARGLVIGGVLSHLCGQ